MTRSELHHKLDLIEKQAHLSLAEFPKRLTREHQLMIIALVRCIRSKADNMPMPDPEATVPLNADVTALRRA